MASAIDIADDIDFPEAVVLIGKTHWRCVSCMMLNPRTASIDQHLNSYHNQPDSSELSMTPLHKKGRGKGQGRFPNKTTNPPSHAESQQKEELKASQKRGNPVRSRHKVGLPRGKGRGFRESRGRRGKGGRGKEKVFTDDLSVEEPVFTKPLTIEESHADSEVERRPDQISGKRKAQDTCPEPSAEEDIDSTETSHEKQTENTEDRADSPREKRARLPSPEESRPTMSPEELPMDAPLFTPEVITYKLSKHQMKEKYVFFVEKAGTTDHLLESECHIDIDPPLPIEIPSLQADILLPPATPLLPYIHGPPETPVPPETPHLPEIPHQPTTSPHPRLEVENPGSIHPQDILQSVASVSGGIISTTTLEPSAKSDVEVCVDIPPPVTDRFSSVPSTMNKSDTGNKELTLGRPTVCRTCGADFDSVEELQSHREEMIKFDVMSCNSCGDKFHGLHQLNIHVFTAHEKLAKKFCFLCDVDCIDGFELEEHLLEHTLVETDQEDASNVPHVCKSCGTEVEGNLSDLVNHYHTVHDQLVCTKCYQIFSNTTEYEGHKVLHSSDSDTPIVYSCPVRDCFQICENREALMDHISWHEDRDVDDDDLNLLHCQQCAQQFRNTTSLLRHLAETHNEPGLRPFVCELCNQAFSHSLELHQHNMVQHAGIKRYGCAYCDQRFAFHSAHRRHVASEHDVAATVLRMTM